MVLDGLVGRITGRNFPVFNPFPEGFEWHGGKDYAYVVVHPGYTRYHGHQEAFRDESKYGSFVEHEANLAALISYLRCSNDLSIFLEEESVYTHKEGLIDTAAPATAIRMIYPDARWGKFSKIVRTPQGGFRQDPNIVYEFLRREGIKELRFAGGLTWNYNKVSGCLNRAIVAFQRQDFEAVYVDGCVFPSKMPKYSAMDICLGVCTPIHWIYGYLLLSSRNLMKRMVETSVKPPTLQQPLRPAP